MHYDQTKENILETEEAESDPLPPSTLEHQVTVLTTATIGNFKIFALAHPEGQYEEVEGLISLPDERTILFEVLLFRVKIVPSAAVNASYTVVFRGSSSS